MAAYYTGIGSRQTPPEFLELFVSLADELARKGYVLRSGGAEGADTAFETGCDRAQGQKEIFLPWKDFNGNASMLYPPAPESYTIAARFHPAWSRLTRGGQYLHARKSHQVLGKSLISPSAFILCWTGPTGGTNQALRIAEEYRVPVFNFINKIYSLDEILAVS